MRHDRITLVTLGVRDLPRARAFYARLGFEEVDGADTVAFFDCGGTRLGLFGLDGLTEELGRDAGTPGAGGVTLACNWPDRAAVDAAFAAALKAGGVAIRAPFETPWGGYSSTWSDPEGHVWEYAWNPFWPLDAEGRVAPA